MKYFRSPAALAAGAASVSLATWSLTLTGVLIAAMVTVGMILSACRRRADRAALAIQLHSRRYRIVRAVLLAVLLTPVLLAAFAVVVVLVFGHPAAGS